MTRPALWMFLAGAVLVTAGFATLAEAVGKYLSEPLPIDSSAGLYVFRVDGLLVSYRPFESAGEPTLIGIGIVLVAASVFIAAAMWRPRT